MIPTKRTKWKYWATCQVLYFTRKDHLGKEGGIANYDHKFEEPYPELQYDVRNEQLIFSGGRYVILPEGVDR